MKKLFLLCALFTGACDTYQESQRSIDYEPVYFAEDDGPQDEPTFGSIYSQSKGNLFAMEARANAVGDILTVAFSESFQATKSQNASTARSTENSVNLPTILDSFLPDSGEFSAGSESSFSGNGSTAQSNSLTGSVSVHVVRVFRNGNLEIVGQKKLTLNNGDEYVRVTGIVRPRDISADNVVQSDRIANADIKYIGAGDIARSGKKGWYSRTLEAITPL